MNNSTKERMEQSCHNCDHSGSDHYGAVLNPETNTKAESGVCKREDCECQKFIHKTELELQKKHETKWKNQEKS